MNNIIYFNNILLEYMILIPTNKYYRNIRRLFFCFLLKFLFFFRILTTFNNKNNMSNAEIFLVFNLNWFINIKHIIYYVEILGSNF